MEPSERHFSRNMDELEEKRRRIQSERCAADIRDILDRPIDGVRYETITQNGDGLSVMLFQLTKYGLTLEVTLPKLYPVDPPVVGFFDGIPKHPDVDQETGRVLRFTSLMSTEEKWTPEGNIRDLVATVVDMLARENTPLALPQQPSPLDNHRHVFALVPKEFSYLCGPGMGFIDTLKREYGRDCRLKFRSSKNRDDGPALIIESSSSETVERVKGNVNEVLMRKGYRRAQVVAPQPSSAENSEVDDTLAFFTFMASSGEGDKAKDLMSFEEVKPSPVTATGGTGDASANGTDAWEAYRAAYFPNAGQVQPPKKRAAMIQYTKSDMIWAVDRVKAMFEQFQLKRSIVWGRISSELKKQETKVDRMEEKLARIAAFLDRQRQTIQVQRQAIAIRQNEVRNAQEQLERYCCVVCCVREKDTAFQCGHMFCNECARSLHAAASDCPMCRSKITAVMKVNQ